MTGDRRPGVNGHQADRGGGQPRIRVLIVEDDRELATMLVDLLTGDGYEVEVAGDGQRGLHLALSREYAVLVVDYGLPAINGLDLIRRLRAAAVATPVMMLTARYAVSDRVAGLDAGAEDYLVKPFDVDELSARIRALHRRHLTSAARLPLGAGELDVAARTVHLATGDKIGLSGREFDLLHLLARYPSTVYPRSELQAKIFGDADAESIVDTYVYYLRRKLGRQAVRTVRGAGYQAGEL